MIKDGNILKLNVKKKPDFHRATCGVREIRTPEPLLTVTDFPDQPLQPLEHHSSFNMLIVLFVRFPGVPLFVLPACKSDFSFSLLRDLRVYCAKSRNFMSKTAGGLLHICNAKLRQFNHICKSLASFMIERRRESSSTIESRLRSSKFGQESTPSLSARRYTRLKSWALSSVDVGKDSGTTVSSRQPQPRQAVVRRHHSGPVLRRRQSFMFEHIFEIPK